MTIQDSLSRRAFYEARSSLAKLREPHEDGSVYLNRFAEIESVRFAVGTGVKDNRPVMRALPWSSFCEGVSLYAGTVIGPTEEDKKSKSRYIVAGEVVRSVAVAAEDGGLGAGLTLDGYRSDISVTAITMLVLDCDAPVASAPLARALDELHLAYCIAPTWASSVEAPRWRCFIPIAPLAVDSSVRGRELARCRYGWLAGLLAELAGLPVECPECEGVGAGATGAGIDGKPTLCKSCLGDGKFRFDLVCWNYSRLHFVGGRKSADVPMDTRIVRSGRGYAIDCAAWLEGSGWAGFWAEAEGLLDAELSVGVGSRGGIGGTVGATGLGDSDLHPDPEISAAIADCQVTLLERVRRAALYVGSPEFPASSKAHHDPRYGHDDLMRACSAIVSGFLVPVDYAEEDWALRVLELAYNPRCMDLSGVPHPWSSREMSRKLREVRAKGGQLGGLLQRASNEGAQFYVVLEDGSQGVTVDLAGVYNARGDQMSVATRSGALLALSIDAARVCPLRAYDPYQLPDGFRPRKTVLEMPMRVSQVGKLSAVSAAGIGGLDSPIVGSGAGPRLGSVSVNQSAQSASGGLSSGGLDSGARLRVVKPSEDGGLGEGGYRPRSKSKIPTEAEWLNQTGPVIIDQDDEAAKRAIVEQMNARYAYVVLNRDAIIVDTIRMLSDNKGVPHWTLRGFSELQSKFQLRLKSASAKSGVEKLTELNRASLWLNSPHRRQYNEHGFRPELSPKDCEIRDSETGSRRILNLFTGWPVKPSNEGLGLIPSFVRLINDAIAGGNEEYARYIWVWFADIFQNPANKPGIALFLYSEIGGTGKGTLLSVMHKLLGRYSMSVQSAEAVSGQWNLHLASKLLVFFDEANDLDKRARADKLNSLITEAEFAACEKFLPLQMCQAYMRFAFASNREDALAIRPQDRRYAAFTVKGSIERDWAFWEELQRELYAPMPALEKVAPLDPVYAAEGKYRGLSALMGHLLWNVRTRGEGAPVPGRPELGGGVNLRQIPRTKLRLDIMSQHLEGLGAFIFDAAIRYHSLGRVDRGSGAARDRESIDVAWPVHTSFDVNASEFSKLYGEWARREKVKAVGAPLWPKLEQIFRIYEEDGSGKFRQASGFGKKRGADGLTWYTLPSGIETDKWLREKYGW